jgi:hypothetical protein
MSDGMNPESFGAVTEEMISSMKQASSWIRFLAICGFIYAGFILMAGILCAVTIPFLNDFGDEFGMNPAVFGILIAVIIFALGVLCIIIVRFLYNFGTKMRTYVQTNNDDALEIAFKNNKSFWKSCSVITIVSIVCIPVSLIIVGVFYVRYF